MRPMKKLIALLILLLAINGVLAQEEESRVPYFQSSGFNAPRLEGWEDQSADTVAQFYLPSASATVRTAMVALADPVAASEADLKTALGNEIGQPIYRGKVNLADGTWHAAIYEPEAHISASVMSRRVGESSVVISFVERDEANRILMLTVAQEGEPRDHALLELEAASDLLLSPLDGEQGNVSELTLPGGKWVIWQRAGHTGMGLAYGNDSFLALAEGPIGANLTVPAEAYYTTLLGFFITTDNSAYSALALAAVFAILGGLLLSFYWRWRNLRQDLAMIARLQAE